MNARPQRRRHLSGSGLAYIVIVGLLGLGALNSQNNMLFFAFGLALAGALVSGVVSGGMLVGLRVKRHVPRTGAVGSPLHIGYTATNRSRWLPMFAVGLSELPPRRAEPDPDGPPVAVLPPTHAFIAHAPARSNVRVDAIVTPARRGVHTFAALRARTSFPFGITRKSVTFLAGPDLPGSRCLIRPEPAPVLRDALRRAIASSYEGDTSATTVGMGDEFFALREYAPGDSARQIAWRASARTGALVVRENAAHSPQRLWVAVVPVPANAAGAAALNERALSLAAGFLLRAAEDGAEVGLSIPSAGIALPPRPGARHVERLLDALALVRLPDEPAPANFPTVSSRAAGWVVVHAGAARPPRAPARAVFVSAMRPDAVLDPAKLEGSPTWR